MVSLVPFKICINISVQLSSFTSLFATCVHNGNKKKTRLFTSLVGLFQSLEITSFTVRNDRYDLFENLITQEKICRC